MTAIVAASSVCALLSGPAMALQLGEISVESSIGQPLRASIAYALQPHESLAEYCIFVQSGDARTDLPAVTRTRLALVNNRIVLRGTTPLLEPLMSLQLTVDCPYTANLSRSYLLMLSPPSATASVFKSSNVSTTASDERAVNPVLSTPRPGDQQTPVATRARARSTVIPPGSNQYRVQRGDTLSGIAAGIPERNTGLWQTVQALFDANPGAFINDDVNRLKAGVTLIIPESVTTADSGVSRAASSPATVTQSTPVSTPAPARETLPRPAAGSQSTRATETGIPAAAVSAPADKSAADAAPSRNNEVVVQVPVTNNSDMGAATRKLPAQIASNKAVPVVGNQVGADTVGNRASVSWLMWLGGSGVAIILVLLLFGRRIRERFEGIQQLALPPRRRRADHGEAIPADDAIDLEIPASDADLSTLDADLTDGSGFDEAVDIDVAADYGFGASGDYSDSVDLDIGDSGAGGAAKETADIYPPKSIRMEETVIVDQEILPGDDANYDMSMIVDVTKQNFEDSDASQHDLQAIAVSKMDDSDDDDTDSYTLNDEKAYQILEQDYEDELTATQALSLEVAAAALDLTRQTGQIDDDATSKLPSAYDRDFGKTPVGNVASDPSLDSMAEDLDKTAEITAEMPLQSEAVNDDDELTLDISIEMPADNDETTVDMLPEFNDVTVEMPTDQNAETAEMPPARQRTNPRKKSKAS